VALITRVMVYKSGVPSRLRELLPDFGDEMCSVATREALL